MIAKKPPMGWNSWNTFGDKINEQLIKEMADRIVEDGYRDLGYEYVIIDDCWSLRKRVDGKLVADPALFPNGMKALAPFVLGSLVFLVHRRKWCGIISSNHTLWLALTVSRL